MASNGNTTPFVTANAGTVGRGFQGGMEYVGDVAEVIFFNSALSLNSRLAVEAYLNAKWNGVLPAGGVVSIASGATLDLNGVSQTIAGLADGAFVALSLRAEAFGDDCRRAVLLVTMRPAPTDCRASVIDRDRLQRQGTLALRRDRGGFFLEAVRPRLYVPGTLTVTNVNGDAGSLKTTSPGPEMRSQWIEPGTAPSTWPARNPKVCG